MSHQLDDEWFDLFLVRLSGGVELHIQENMIKKIRWGKWFLYVVLILVLLWTADLSIHGLRLWRTFQNMHNRLSDANQSLSGQEASTWVLQASEDLHAVRRDVSPFFPFLRVLSQLPKIGPQMSQIEPLLNYAHGLGQAGKAAVLLTEPLWKNIGGEESGQKLLGSFQSHPAEIQQFVVAVNQVAQARQQLRPELLPDVLRSPFQKLDSAFVYLQEVAQVLPLIPDLLGAQQSRTYLLLAQNRDELRATGGFISGIGTVLINKANISAFDLGDSYRVDDYSKNYPEPPKPIQMYMLAGYWVTRDANWSPDFPTSALQTQKLYELSTGTHTDGVVAFDQSMVRRILEAIGPVQVANSKDWVTAETVENYMQQSWAPAPEQNVSEDWWRQRKDFMGQLGKSLINRILSLRDPSSVFALVKQLDAGIREGHLLIYFNSAQLEQTLTRLGLDGAVHPDSGDYLMLVDSNIGFNKTDAVIERELSYSLDFSQPGTPRAQLRVHYHHPVQKDVPCKHEASYGTGTYENMIERCYWDYWRVFVMEGTHLEASYTQPVPAEWLLNQQSEDGVVVNQSNGLGTQEISGLMVLPTGSDQEIGINLQLPEKAIISTPEGGWNYVLHVQKQPGIESLPFTIQITFPNGCRIPDTGNEQWSWHGNLMQSKTIEVSCIPGMSH